MIHPETATPVWRIATLFPYQGAWSEQEYLALDTNRRVEFDNGYVDVHDVPTDQHQAIILFFRGLYTLVPRPPEITIQDGRTSWT